MRFMVIVKGDKRTEAGVLPTRKELEGMGVFNEALMKAGVWVDAMGLQPTSKGAKVSFGGGKPQVIDGPFTETKELIAGFWIIKVKSKEEAIERAKKVPFQHLPGDGRVPELEVRQVYEQEDLADVK